MSHQALLKRAACVTFALGLAFCGGGGGGGSGGGGATQSAGWVVAMDAGAPAINFYHADDPGNVINSIPGAKFINLTANNPFVDATQTSLLYGAFSANAYTTIGITTGGVQTTIANTAGKSYRVLGYVGNRIIYLEYTLGVDSYTIWSNAITGSDPKQIVPGICTSSAQPAFPVFNVDPAGGVAIECTLSAVYRIFWSDGTAPAVQLSPLLTATEFPVGISITQPGCISASCTAHVYLRAFSGANNGFVLAEALDASAPIKIMSSTPGTYSFIGVFNGRIMITAQHAGPTYGLYSFGLDGSSNQDTIIAPAGNAQSFNYSPSLWRAPDGKSALIQSANAYGTFMAIAAAGGGTVDLTEGNTITPDIAALIPNDLVVVHYAGGFRAKSRFTGATYGNFGSSATTEFLGASDDWVLVFNSTLNRIFSYRNNGAASNALSPAPTASGSILAPSGYTLVLPNKLVLWRADDGTTWLASMNKGEPGAINPQMIDATPTTNVVGATLATNPDRLFWVSRRTATDEDTMAIDLTTMTVTTVAGAGAARADGRFLPH